MNRIEELIKEKCPNGVEFYKLSEIGEHFTGLSGKSKDDFENGNYKYITYSNIFNNPSTNLDIDDFVNIRENETQNSIKYKDILVAGSSENLEDSGMISVVTRVPKELIYLNSFCFGFRLNDEFYNRYNSDFLKHLFRDNNFRNEIITCSFGVTRYNLSKDKFLKIKIPCPPLEIQEEIVKILDKFGELEVKLEAELEARKNQYEFWRDKIFEYECNHNSKLVLSNAIVRLTTGLNPRQNFKLNLPGADMYYVTGKDVYNHQINIGDKTDLISADIVNMINKRAKLEDDILMFASTGTGTVGRMTYVDKYDKTWNVSETMFLIKTKNILMTKYLMYYLESTVALKQFKNKISKGSVPHLKVKDLLNVEVPIPNIEKQIRIIEIIDKFDKLVNDILEGLPAEIELRRKQYEYYRNKLLSFKELSSDE